MKAAEVFQEISPADFFYRNRDIAGFTNPTRAIYSTIRELLENSLDACEVHAITPDIYMRISHESGPADGPGVYRIRVMDNGIGVPSKLIPSAFGQVLFGSKYKLRQTRGQFGLGGKMAILYGQITTHSEAVVFSSTGPTKIHELRLRIDVVEFDSVLREMPGFVAISDKGELVPRMLFNDVANCHVFWVF